MLTTSKGGDKLIYETEEPAPDNGGDQEPGPTNPEPEPTDGEE